MKEIDDLRHCTEAYFYIDCLLIYAALNINIQFQVKLRALSPEKMLD